ncbi:MAG: hypothetical protein AAF998_02855 [Bacteroidota bacterium]
MRFLILQLFKDKNGDFSLREISTVLFVLMTVLSWFVDTFTPLETPEYMFWGFLSLVGVGKFGYSFEKRGSTPAPRIVRIDPPEFAGEALNGPAPPDLADPDFPNDKKEV